MSGDDLTASLAGARPDPLLAEFVTEGPPNDQGPALADFDRERGDDATNPQAGSRADVLNDLAGLDLGVGRREVDPPQAASVSSSDALAGIALDGPSAASAPAKRAAAEEDDDDEDDDPPRARGTSLPMMLLASYASAVTLGLVWVLWTGRRFREPAEADFLPPADTRTDPGARADGSRRVVAPRPVPAANLAGLGKTIRLGQIDVTPLAVTSGPVKLERNVSDGQRKGGGEGALFLRLRLRNASADKVIAPLDEAFLRDRPRADPDSFIETSAGGPTIAQYPLAVESEWSIVGQEFRDLKPGQVMETLVVSAPDAVAHETPEMTWRVRLRTDINHTDDLGVPFKKSDIKPVR